MGVYPYEKAGKKHYYYAFGVVDQKGKRKTIKARGFAKERDARAAEREARNKWEGEKGLNPTDLPFGRYVEDWLANKQDIGNETRLNYESFIRAHILPHPMGKKAVQEITARDVEAFVGYLRSKGRASGTVRNGFNLINGALNAAVKKEIILRSPTAQLDTKPRRVKVKMDYWRAEEVIDFLSKVEHRNKIAFILAVHCGMRIGEILGLDRNMDIDIKNKRIHIRQIITSSSTIKQGAKTMSGNRSIAVSDFVAEALQKHMDQTNREAETTEGFEDHGLLICTPKGFPVAPNTMRFFWTKLLKETGARKIRFHDLRHTCASLLLQAGKHPKVVQELLGHSSITMTLDLYSHLAPGMLADAADTLSELLTTKITTGEPGTPAT